MRQAFPIDLSSSFETVFGFSAAPCPYTDARTPRGQESEILRISVGIPDICEFRAIAFACECAGEKGPTRERRASQKPKSLTFQKFRPDFTTDLKEAWILCHSVELQNHAKTDSARPSTARRRTPPVFCVAQLCTPANSASSASFLN